MRVFLHILDVDVFSEAHKLAATLIQQETLPPDMIVSGGTILYKFVMPNLCWHSTLIVMIGCHKTLECLSIPNV